MLVMGLPKVKGERREKGGGEGRTMRVKDGRCRQPGMAFNEIKGFASKSCRGVVPAVNVTGRVCPCPHLNQDSLIFRAGSSMYGMSIQLACPCVYFDCRRSGAGGFLLPLSGGADSSSTAAIVGAMCQVRIRLAAITGPILIALPTF